MNSSTPDNPTTGAHTNQHQETCATTEDNLEDLQKLLKTKEDQLQQVLQKTSEYQCRLERLSRVLKQQQPE